MSSLGTRWGGLAVGVIGLMTVMRSIGVCQGAVIAYQPFNYTRPPTTSSPVHAKGFAGNWVGGGSANIGKIVPGSLSDPTHTLATKGNSLIPDPSTYGCISRFSTAAQSAINALSTKAKVRTIYYSVLLEPMGALKNAQWMGIVLAYSVPIHNGSNGLFVGAQGFGNRPKWFVHTNGGPLNKNTSASTAVAPPTAGRTVFIVIQDIRAKTRRGKDVICLYVNPKPGAVMPAKPEATVKLQLAAGKITNLFIADPPNEQKYRIDEFRAGATWADVTPQSLGRRH